METIFYCWQIGPNVYKIRKDDPFPDYLGIDVIEGKGKQMAFLDKTTILTAQNGIELIAKIAQLELTASTIEIEFHTTVSKQRTYYNRSIGELQQLAKAIRQFDVF